MRITVHFEGELKHGSYDFDEEIEIDEDLIADYVISWSKLNLTKEEKAGFKKGIKEMLDNDLLDTLEDDDSFVEWLHDKFEDEILSSGRFDENDYEW